jgi:2-iminobutanoate/2-iminopropanoate deaminase
MNVRHNPIAVAPGFDTIYAHAVAVPVQSQLLYVSGQIGKSGGDPAPASFEAQFRLAIANLNQILAGAGMTIDDVVKLVFYVTRAADLQALGEIRRELLAVAPAVTTLVVSALAAPDLLVEVEATAAR